MCGPSWPAPRCDRSSRRRRRAARSRAASPVRAARPCAGLEVSATTCRCTGRRHLRPRGRGARPLDARRLGGRQAAPCSIRWSRRARPLTSWPAPSCTPTTRRCRCWHPGSGKTKTGRLWTYVRDDRPAGSDGPPAVWFALHAGPQGRTSADTPEEVRRHRCRPMPMPASTRSTQTGRIAGSRVLGARPAQVLRSACRSPLDADGGGAATDRRTVCHRDDDPGQAAG